MGKLEIADRRSENAEIADRRSENAEMDSGRLHVRIDKVRNHEL